MYLVIISPALSPAGKVRTTPTAALAGVVGVPMILHSPRKGV